MHLSIHKILRLASLVMLLALTMSSLLTLASSRPAYADGGAPNLAYVAGAGQGISVIDVRLQKVTKTIPLKGDPHTTLLSLDGSMLFVTQPASNQVSVLDTHDGRVLCSASVPVQPSLLAYDPDAKRIYTGGNQGKNVYEINPTNCMIEATLATEGPVYGLALARVSSSGSSELGNQLWISSTEHVTIYDLKQREQLSNVAIEGGPQYLSIPPGMTIYVNTRAGDIQAIDLSTHKVTRILSGGDYGPMDYDETTGEMYVPDRANRQMLVLNPVHSGFQLPKEPSRVIRLDAKPQSVAITSDGQLGFIALANGKVAMLDVSGRTIVNTFDVGGQPQFIITGLYPPATAQATQTSFWSQWPSMLAFVLVVILLIGIVLLLLRRRARTKHIAEEPDSE